MQTVRLCGIMRLPEQAFPILNLQERATMNTIETRYQAWLAQPGLPEDHLDA